MVEDDDVYVSNKCQRLPPLSDKQFPFRRIDSTLSTADHLLIVLLGKWPVISIGEVHRSSGALERRETRLRGTS